MGISMAISSVKSPHYQQGALLIEILVSLVLGAMAISVMISILFTGYRVASTNTLDLLVLQNLSITSQMMRSDIQRAGYSGTSGSSVKLLGATDVVVVSGASMGFVYYEPSSDQYQHVRYKADSNKLYSCEKKSATILSFNSLTDCNNMFDQNMLSVASFAVSTLPLQTSAATSTIVNLYLEAELLDGRFNHSVAMQTKQRNWL